MELTDTTTRAGIRVITEPMPSMRSVALGLWFRVGSRDEGPAEHGCSHFLEHTLFKGTRRRSARDIAEALDGIGGEANAFTSRELTCFYARVLDRDLPLAMDVLADMVRDATNVPGDVDAERDVILEEISMLLDTPDELVMADLSDLVFDGHPLGLETLGSVESIAAMDRDTIHEWYVSRYRPEDLVVAVAGNVDHDQVVKLVDDLLGDLGRPGRGTRPRRRPEALRTGQVHVRRRPTEQAHVAVGAPGVDVHDPRRPALRLASTVLGEGMSSRLFQEIREVRGLAYTVFSFVGSYSDAGMVGAYVGTTPSRVAGTLQVLREELSRLPGTITADELERARSALTGGMVLGLEDPASRMVRLGQLAATDRALLSVDEAIARYDAVTSDDLAAAAELFAMPRSVAVVGPFDEDAADAFAIGTGTS
jgi:predicted Zn-dependent peptidase